MQSGIISLVSDFSVDCVIRGGRVSLAHLVEFSHFVDLFVLEDNIFVDASSLSTYLEPFASDAKSPLKALPSSPLSDSVYHISEGTREIYDAAPVERSFSMGSYEYWLSLPSEEKANLPVSRPSKSYWKREGLLVASRELSQNIDLALEQLADTENTLLPSSRNLLPFLHVFHQMETPALNLYRVGAEAHRALVEQVLAHTRPRTVYLPPLLSILLSRCESSEDLPRRLIELRAEYSEFRRDVSGWLDRFDQTTSLAEKIEIHAELQNSMDSVSKGYEDKRVGFYKEVAGALIDAAEEGDLKKAITKPAFALIKHGLTSIAPELIGTRRFTGIVNLLDDATRIEDYGQLLRRVFGFALDISQKEITEAKKYRSHIISSYDFRLPTPG